MDIDGMGKQIVERFFEMGWVRKLPDVYRLDYSQIAQLEGFGQKSADNLEKAIERFPLLERAQLLTQWAGLYEVTPDHQAIIGKLPLDGFYTCTGFSGHGFMHGPICGLLMAEEILDGRAHTVNIDPLRYQRFLTQALHPEKNVV